MSKIDVLKDILKRKQERIILAKQVLSEEDIKLKIKDLPPTRGFIQAINKPRNICLIAEIKRQSPSGLNPRQDFNHQEIARIYEEAQVQAVSVLTEEDYFGGSLLHINEVKSIFSGPVLRKDFMIEPYQIYESRLYGADAILLIADLLTKDKLIEFTTIASALGLDFLIEVHNEKELKKVLNLKVPLIGINNRDLHTLEIDLKTTERLFPLIPRDKLVVVESGLKKRQDVLFLKILGVNAVLIGAAFMESCNIKQTVEEIMGW